MRTDTSSAPGSSPTKAFLEIRMGNGPAIRHTLDDTHVVLGRSPDLKLTLDHHTVSRRHAEVFCDPFGRWWIRDLGSTNGTLLNGEEITERVLQPGDFITIGDFTLLFTVEAPTTKRGSVSTRELIVREDSPTALRTLWDFEPPRIAANHLFTVLDFGRRLLHLEDPGERLNALCALAVKPEFRAQTAMALRLKGEGGITVLAGPERALKDDRDEPYISRRVLTSLRDTGEPVLAGNLALGDGNQKSSVDLTISRDIRAMWVVACPLRRDEELLDALYVTLPPECGSVEWLSLFALVAEQFAHSESAWEARRHAQAHAAIERELETARQIQRALVPTKVDYPGLGVAIGFEPCKWVGGDYADIVPMPDGRVLMSVADVCGKGLQAALIASSLHTMVRATADAGRPLVDLMQRLNKHLCAYLPMHSFVTMICVALDLATGQVECVNAGHPPGVIGGTDGKIRYMQTAVNPALGMLEVPLVSETTVLRPGEVLALYTDGLSELKNSNKEMLGVDDLAAGFGRICAMSAGAHMSELADRLNEMLDTFRGDQLPEDDRAFILARRKPPTLR
ncbi:MAG: SpoIIE family protein phosphatase [Polyangiaceae bacterium]|nr:SpoIIE family protein phosphatase [Polyangiaceae bacterium]